MTVQAGTELTLELLVGDMPEIPCEHSQHGTDSRFHQDEAATHYVQGFCRCSGWTEAYAACPKFVASIQESGLNRCPRCGYLARRNTVFKVLGPIESSPK